MQKDVIVSIIIVNYNTKALLKQTVQAVLNNTYELDGEIIIVDNNSTDGSIEMVEQEFLSKKYTSLSVQFIKNDDNLGFAKANNIGIKASKGRYILLLNSDTVVSKESIKKCIEFAEADTNIGVVGCKVVLPDGKLDKACKRSFPTPSNSLFHSLKLDKFFPESRLFGSYNLTYVNENSVCEVDCVVGAFMLVKKETINLVGLLDEDFFMYGEDIDWCYRIKNNGYKVYYYPEAQITHYKKASGKRSTKVIHAFYYSMILFYNKHYKNKYNALIRALVYAGVRVMLCMALIKNLFKDR